MIPALEENFNLDFKVTVMAGMTEMKNSYMGFLDQNYLGKSIVKKQRNSIRPLTHFILTKHK